MWQCVETPSTGGGREGGGPRQTRIHLAGGGGQCVMLGSPHGLPAGLVTWQPHGGCAVACSGMVDQLRLNEILQRTALGTDFTLSCILYIRKTTKRECEGRGSTVFCFLFDIKIKQEVYARLCVSCFWLPWERNDLLWSAIVCSAITICIQIISSETTGPILTMPHMEHPNTDMIQIKLSIKPVKKLPALICFEG